MDFNATFIVSVINFIVFTLIMNAIFYKPLQKVVLERQKFIDDTLEEAKVHTQKSEAILKDKERKLEKTKHDAKKIILDKSEEVKTHKAALAADAQQKAARTVESAKDELQKSKDEAQIVLSEEAKKLAQAISAKILGDK
jgi:F-type H+-transporting ATPase subunit b